MTAVNLDSLGQAKGTLIDLAIRFGPRLLSESIILVAGFMIGRWVAGAGIELATQGVLGNVIAGLTIIFTKPYRVGEYIAIVGVEGKVDTLTSSSPSALRLPLARKVCGCLWLHAHRPDKSGWYGAQAP